MKLRLCFVAVWIFRHAASGFVHSPTVNRQGASISCNEWLKTHTACTAVSTADSSVQRRRLLGGSITTAAAGFLGGGSASNEAAVSIKPLVDMPLRRLQLPKGGVGRDYVVVPLSFAGSDKVQIHVALFYTKRLREVMWNILISPSVLFFLLYSFNHSMIRSSNMKFCVRWKNFCWTREML